MALAFRFSARQGLCSQEDAHRVTRHLKAVGLPYDLASSHVRSEEHTSELQSLMRISYAVFCLKKKIDEIHNFTSISTIKNAVENNTKRRCDEYNKKQ